MPFVLDASVVVCWAFDDENHPVAAAALNRLRFDEARAPAHWWFEIRNVLVVNERRGRIQPSDTEIFLDGIERLSVATDHAPDGKAVLDLARRHRLTFYDAAYVELGRRLGAPIATLDNRLAAAALAESVPLFSAP